jgi:hypothetical protein
VTRGRPAQDLPDKICVVCGAAFNRKRFSNGKLEATTQYRARQTCSPACAEALRIRNRSPHVGRRASVDWDAVDWTRRDADLARELDVTPTRVAQVRKQRAQNPQPRRAPPVKPAVPDARGLAALPKRDLLSIIEDLNAKPEPVPVPVTPQLETLRQELADAKAELKQAREEAKRLRFDLTAARTELEEVLAQNQRLARRALRTPRTDRDPALQAALDAAIARHPVLAELIADPPPPEKSALDLPNGGQYGSAPRA